MQEKLKNCYIDDLVVTKEEDPTVSVEALLPQAKNIKIATITVGNSKTDIFAPKTEGSGSVVSISDTLPTGQKIATLTIDGEPTEIKAPNFENRDIDLKTIADCANAIKQLLMLLGIDESKIHTD